MQDKIKQLYDEMKELTLDSQVAKSIYDLVLKDESLDTVMWLQEIRRTAYKAVAEIWNLLPRNTWEAYHQMGQYDLREQVLLREARKYLRIQWYKRYDKQKNDSENLERKRIRSEGSESVQDSDRD